MILSERFREALSWAVELHSEQKRKGTEIPYISHLMAVAAIVMENGGNEEEVIAALLHDAIEDRKEGKTHEEVYNEIKERFGEKAADIVAECTDSWDTPKEPWKVRKEKYLEHLSEASESALLVSAADKLHNARCILFDYREKGETLWKRFNVSSRAEVIWYYLSLVEAFERRNKHLPLVKELKRTVKEIVNISLT